MKMLRESFANDLNTLLSGAWENSAEKQLVNVIFKNKDKILANEDSGKKFIGQLSEKNKNLIKNNCSNEFVSALNLLTGTETAPDPSISEKIIKAGKVINEVLKLNEVTTQEDLFRDDIINYISISKGEELMSLFSLITGFDAEEYDEQGLRKEMIDRLTEGGVDDDEIREFYKIICKNDPLFGNYRKYLVVENKSQQNTKKNTMYRYYRVQYLNEAKYVAVPPFAVNTLMEHESVMQFALESKQLKFDKGVDYVIEVSEQEFKEVNSDLGEDYGSESKEEKPQDASIDSSKNKFDTVGKGENKGGAKQDKGKDLHEALLNIFEGGKSSKKKLNEWGDENSNDYENEEGNSYQTSSLKEEMEDFDLGQRIHQDSESDWDPTLEDDYELEDDLNGGKEAADEIYYRELYQGEKQAGLHNTGIDDEQAAENELRGQGRRQLGLDEGIDPDENEWPTGGFGEGEFNSDQKDFEEIEESTSSNHATGREKVYDSENKIKDFNSSEDESGDNQTVMGDDSTKHMTLHEGRFGSVACPKCSEKDSYSIAGGYMECPNCHYHWKGLNENNTSDINVISDQPAFANNRKKIEGLNPYGSETEPEYLDDTEVLQEKLTKYILRNCAGSRAFIKEGKFQMQDFMSSKTYGYLNMLEEAFAKSLTEDVVSEMQVDDITVNFSLSTVEIAYFYPSDEEDRIITSTTDEFFGWLESKDPTWEDWNRKSEGDDNFHDTKEYWLNYDVKSQMRIARQFLIDVKGVSKTL